MGGMVWTSELSGCELLSSLLSSLLSVMLYVQAASLPAEQPHGESCASQAMTTSSYAASLNPRAIQTESVQSAGTSTGRTARGETNGKGE